MYQPLIKFHPHPAIFTQVLRIYEYDIKVKLFFLLVAIIIENVKISPCFRLDYVKKVAVFCR